MKINGIEDKMEISISPRDLLFLSCLVLSFLLIFNKIPFWWIPLIAAFVLSIFSIEVRKQ
jgi:hypothetical protein